MNKGTCKGCGAAILWVPMPSGKMMPVDEKPVKVLVFITHQGHGEVHEIPEVREGYVPHWGTCPQAAQFKKEKP